MNDRAGKKGEESRFEMWQFSVSLWGPQANVSVVYNITFVSSINV